MKLSFNSDSQDDVHPPDSRLLGTHFAVAEILNASGMGEEIDSVLRDMESIGCLREDGSTDAGLILDTALWIEATA